MSRPTLDSPFPYTRGDLAAITGVGVPTIKNLQVGRVLPTRTTGTGNPNGFDDEDVLRAMLAKELLRVGLQVASIHSLFEAVQTPTAPSAKPWSWLDSDDARAHGAALVLILSHRSMSSTTGMAYLTTLKDARRWQGNRGNRTAIVIGVSSFIRELEERSGRPFRLTTTTHTTRTTN